MKVKSNQSDCLFEFHNVNSCTGLSLNRPRYYSRLPVRALRFRKKYFDSIWFDFPKRIDFFDSIRFSTSLPCRRIGYYRWLCCQTSALLRHHESHSQLHIDVGCDVSYNNWAEHCYITAEYGTMIINQANAAAELNGGFFNKTNRFELIRPKRISELIQIANRNALLAVPHSCVVLSLQH